MDATVTKVEAGICTEDLLSEYLRRRGLPKYDAQGNVN